MYIFGLLFRKERIPVIRRRHKGLFDRSGTEPPIKIQDRAGLVIGAGAPRTTEWLLTDYSSCGLVIDIEIPGCISQLRAPVGQICAARTTPRSRPERHYYGRGRSQSDTSRIGGVVEEHGCVACAAGTEFFQTCDWTA